MSLQVYVPRDMALPDNDQWQFRFQIESATSDRIYIISQTRNEGTGPAAAPATKDTGIANTCPPWACPARNNLLTLTLSKNRSWPKDF